MDKFERAVDKAKDLVAGAADAATGGETKSGERADQTGSSAGTGNGATSGNGAQAAAQGESRQRTQGGLGTVVEVKGPVVDVRFPRRRYRRSTTP